MLVLNEETRNDFVCKELDKEAALYFRDDFRNARAAVLADAEGYQKVLFALERFGQFIRIREAQGLGDYKGDIVAFVRRNHSREGNISQEHFTSFGRLYELVNQGRNDALHQGAKGRNLTAQIVRLCLIIEDSLTGKVRGERMKDDKIKDYMVSNPTTAALWQPISYIRHIMLENSFTYLPFYDESSDCWRVAADYHVAKFLNEEDCRKERLTFTLEQALRGGKLVARKAATVSSNDTVGKALMQSDIFSKGLPLLVVRSKCEKEVIGIVTPFDLL